MYPNCNICTSIYIYLYLKVTGETRTRTETASLSTQENISPLMFFRTPKCILACENLWLFVLIKSSFFLTFVQTLKMISIHLSIYLSIHVFSVHFFLPFSPSPSPPHPPLPNFPACLFLALSRHVNTLQAISGMNMTNMAIALFADFQSMLRIYLHYS